MGSSWRVVDGAPSSAVILHVPHASRDIPADARERLLLDDAALAAELEAITDAETDRLAEAAADLAATKPWIFVNRNSRLVVDPERFPDEREEMLAVGMGAVYTRTTAGTILREPNPDDDERLLARYYRPYAAALAELVNDRLAHIGQVVILDIHSFPAEPLPYELHQHQARPPLCIGADPFHTPDDLVKMIAASWPEPSGINEPFAGCYVPLEHHGVSRNVRGAMIEIRRDRMSAEPGRLAQALAQAVDLCAR